MADERLVCVVDDDPDIRLSLQLLVEGMGEKVATFESAESFLNARIFGVPGCLLLDIRMPGMDGLELLNRLRRRESGIPVIVFTGHGDIAKAVEAMRYGAFDFLEKTADPQTIIETLRRALEVDEQRRENTSSILSRLASLYDLSIREVEILSGTVDGMSANLIGERLGISKRTVEKHQENIKKTFGVKNVAQLVRVFTEYRNGVK